MEDTIEMLAVAVDSIENPWIRGKLGFYVKEDYNKICDNDDYEFRIMRCIYTFLHFYFEYYNELKNNNILKNAVNDTIKLCPWLYSSIYSKDMMETNKLIIDNL